MGVQQLKIVTRSAIKKNQGLGHVALFNADGSPFEAGTAGPAAHVAPVSVVNATDLASAEALANANKAAINAVIASLIAGGQMAAS